MSYGCLWFRSTARSKVSKFLRFREVFFVKKIEFSQFLSFSFLPSFSLMCTWQKRVSRLPPLLEPLNRPPSTGPPNYTVLYRARAAGLSKKAREKAFTFLPYRLILFNIASCWRSIAIKKALGKENE
jgi:hypothetical protein